MIYIKIAFVKLLVNLLFSDKIIEWEIFHLFDYINYLQLIINILQTVKDFIKYLVSILK